MKNLILSLITMLFVSTMSSQTVVDTVLSTKSNMHGWSVPTPTNATTSYPSTTTKFTFAIPASGTGKAKIDTTILGSYDSVKVFTKVMTTISNLDLTVNTSTVSAGVNVFKFNTNSINFDIVVINSNTSFPLSGTFQMSVDSIVGFKTVNSAGIKSVDLASKGLKLFSFGNTVKVNGNISEDLKLNIFDMSGQIVLSTDLKNEVMTNLTNGIYIASVSDSKGNVIENKKIFITQ